MNLHHLLLLLSSQCVSFVDAFQLLSHSNSHLLQRRHAIPFSKSSLNSIVDSPLDNQDTERHVSSSAASAASSSSFLVSFT
mmetsp:Transcript_20590/g.23874  ORF Transcript_20590/g.23874 Transcript_20590/m.23874 type:complete len:81 (-) Transcript_20590:305-547(-)